MKQLLLRSTLTILFYGIWVIWLWRLDHVFMIDDSPAIWEAIGLLLSGIGLLLWIVWSLAHWKQDHELGLSGLLLLLLLPVIGILRSQLAPVIPLLSIITFWLLAGVCLGHPAKDRSLGWLLGGTVVLILLCLLTPSTSARLYLAGYRSPAVAMRTQLSGDQYHQITTYKFSHPNTTEVQLIGSATDPRLSVDVHQVGCLYLPVEDKWWIGG